MADYDRPHIDITPLLSAHSYKAHQPNGVKTFTRNRQQHGDLLSEGLAASYEAADERRTAAQEAHEGIAPSEGAFVTVALHPEAREVQFEKPEKGVRQSAAGYDAAETERKMVLYLRDQEARNYISERVERYRSGELTSSGNPPLAAEMQPIERFAPTQLADFWREAPANLPSDFSATKWWGLWCWEDFVDDVVGLAQACNMQVAPQDRWSTFPDVQVVPVYATREQLQSMLDLGKPGLAEVGFATDDPSVLIEFSGREQDGLVDNLASRITWPGSEVPAVCLLDTGVNRGHPLIEPALAERDAQAIDEAWGVDDHDRPGHGTPMAGLALHGDLTGPLADLSTMKLRHRLESIKVLPPHVRGNDDPANYGAVTQAAVALAEERNPERKRVICSAVTNDGRPGDRPTRWSAAIDSIASGVDAADGEENPRRLFIQAIGNIGHDNNWASINDMSLHPGEDPSQAWNALTIGGVTFKDDIVARDQGAWSACARIGEVSPYSRTSNTWPDNTTPIKPEVVFEAGNRATNGPMDQVTDAMPSLSLVSTGKGGAGDAITPFHATSAATAQAARMAAQIAAEHPEYWPETIRALMVHSAEWTPPMRAEAEAAAGMTGRRALRRKFGYGTPVLSRALASASNDLALVAQAYIQPFDQPERSRRNPEQRVGPRTFGDAHYCDLPWPTSVLEDLENCPVELKVTLSYFVEPYPLSGSMLDPARYRSCGLRFDLRRRRETEAEFLRRKNADWGDRVVGAETDSGWKFGERSVSAGSLHCDTWNGTAIELASRSQLAIYPVMGWWRDRPSQGRFLDKTRYALVVTLTAPQTDIDLQAEVEVTAQSMIAAKTNVRIDIQT